MAKGAGCPGPLLLAGPRHRRGPEPFSLLTSDGGDHGLVTGPSFWMFSPVVSKHFGEMLCCAGLVLSKLTSHDTLAAVVETVVLVVCTVVPEAALTVTSWL